MLWFFCKHCLSQGRHDTCSRTYCLLSTAKRQTGAHFPSSCVAPCKSHWFSSVASDTWAHLHLTHIPLKHHNHSTDPAYIKVWSKHSFLSARPVKAHPRCALKVFKTKWESLIIHEDHTMQMSYLSSLVSATSRTSSHYADCLIVACTFNGSLWGFHTTAAPRTSFTNAFLLILQTWGTSQNYFMW